MILSVDFNPGINRCLYIDQIKKGSNNPLFKYNLSIYGSAMTLNKLLALLNEETLVTGFLGGKNRYLYKSLLNSESKTAFIDIKDKLYERIVLIEDDGLKTSFDIIPKITKREITEFINSYHSLMKKSNYIVIFDELTSEMPGDLIKNLVKISSTEEVITILEVISNCTISSLDEKPNIVISDRETLEEMTNLELKKNDKVEMTYAMNYIFSKGVEMVFINLYEDGFLFGEKDKRYYIKGDEMEFTSKTNHGIIAGILIGLKRDYDITMFLEICYSFNKAYNTKDNLEDMSRIDLKKGMSNIEIINI